LSNVYSVLLIDHDPALSKTFPAGSSSDALRITRTVEAGKTAIRNKASHFSAVFFNPGLSGFEGAQLLPLLRRHHPVTPVYAIFEGKPLLSPAEIQRCGISGLIPRSALPQKILPLLNTKTIAPPPSAHSISEIDSEAEGYLPVPILDLASGAPSIFDIYLRLPGPQYLKILNAGDIFAKARIQTYLAKGLTHFYLSRQNHKQSVSYCDQLAHYLIEKAGRPLEPEALEALKRGQRILNSIKGTRLDENHLRYLSEFLSDIYSFLKKLKLDDHAEIREIKRSLPAYDHAVGTTLIAGLLGLSLRFSSLSTFELLGQAAFLHNIGLYKMPAHFLEEDQSTMNEYDRDLFRTHPLTGAKILSKMPQIDSAVIQAVAQHHERRDNRGFPRTSTATQISRMAEIVGLSSEYAHLLTRLRKEPSLDWKQFLEEEVFNGYSPSLIQSFRQLFMTN
jgi:response regulator RpfG family c-di-GMP phosphodiesterase